MNRSGGLSQKTYGKKEEWNEALKGWEEQVGINPLASLDGTLVRALQYMLENGSDLVLDQDGLEAGKGRLASALRNNDLKEIMSSVAGLGYDHSGSDRNYSISAKNIIRLLGSNGTNGLGGYVFVVSSNLDKRIAEIDSANRPSEDYSKPV
ncbi:MAG: hypothetical protein PHT54_04345 [Candidatus Nanoarchaeia archaeon]|nr:hypothetical protein [Candidatus Nanoarchaeia archaeon]